MATSAVHAFSSLIQLSDEGSPVKWRNIAEVARISGPSISADTVDVTSMDSTGKWREFIQALRAGGEFTVEANYLPADASHQDVFDNIGQAVVANQVRPWRIIYPDWASGSHSGTVTADAGTDLITLASHGLETGQMVIFSSTTTLPAPLVAGTIYFVRWNNANTVYLHSTNAAAYAGSGTIDITDTGTGVHTMKWGSKLSFNALAITYEPQADVSAQGKITFRFKIDGAPLLA